MSAFRIDGTFTTASAVGQARISYPIPQDSTAKIYSQDFMVFFANYAAPVIGSAHGVFTTAYCIGDSELEDLGAGVARYTRQWATIPAARDEYGSFAYTFPGLLGAAPPPYSQFWFADLDGGRDPRSETVVSRMHHEFFLCVTGQTYETPDEIPIIGAQEYTLVGNTNARFEYLLPNGIFYDNTTPTKEAYETMITNGTELVAEDSVIQRLYGHIYERMTRYVKAK